jgi:NTP pyrophosphatase (non-canonical NTP hydrolase)
MENIARVKAEEKANVAGWCSAFQGELKHATDKHPDWPADVIHAAAILQEEAGELIQAALDYYYSHGSKWALIQEAEQCGAMAIRFLLNIERYKRKNDADS